MAETSVKKKRKQWDKSAMQKAVEACRQKEMGYLKASKIYGVPKGTLERYVRDENSNIDAKLGRKSSIPAWVESKMIDYLLEMDRRYNGLRKTDIQRMAFDLCVKNNVPHPFNNEAKKAGKKWLCLFLKRHPMISFRTPQGVSKARLQGFTRQNVDTFFDLYESTIEKFNINMNRIFNVDETGITIVQHKHNKVISLKGKKRIGKITAQERGKLITVVPCMNATGVFVPPLMVFPRKNMKQELLNGAPLGTIARCHQSGWIQADIFTDWLRHFVENTQPSAENPVLLILDGHYSHTRNADVIAIGREKHVHILSLPPHSSHRIQPLDVSFMAPFKTYYSQEIENWSANHRDRTLSVYCLAEIFGTAYQRAATMSVAANGFRKTGLVPLNRHAFTDEDFAAEEARIGNSSNPTDSKLPPDMSAMPAPSSSMDPPSTPLTVDPYALTPSTPTTPFSDLSDVTPPPLPQPKPLSSRAGKAAVITGTPYKDKLEEQKKIAEKKVQQKGKKPVGEKVRKQLFSSKPKKAKIETDTEESDASISSGESLWEEELSSDNDDGPKWQPVRRLKGEYIVVEYDDKFYPGRIEDFLADGSGAEVSCMKALGGLWKWPQPPDTLQYPWEKIVSHIPAPMKTSKTRELYSVPDLAFQEVFSKK